MSRALRTAAGGMVYHVLNRANARLPLFGKDGDYAAFERVLGEARDYCARRRGRRKGVSRHAAYGTLKP
jgi:putative transposase